jgi:hypothetical protein
VPHIPDFLCSFVGSLNFMRLSFKERRTRGPVQSCVQEIRGISLVFCEMWDTAGLPLKPVAVATTPQGKETAGPSTTLRSGRDDNSSAGARFVADALAGLTKLSSRPERSVVEGPAVSFPVITHR